MIDVGPEEILLLGFSAALLTALHDTVPDGSVLVVEEPDVAAARGVHRLALGHPSISRVVLEEYQDPAGLAGLMAREPAVARARAVVPGGEYAVLPAAMVADRIGAPGAGIAAARMFRDKLALRELTTASGIRNPAYTLVTRLADAEQFFRDSGGRACVLKPTSRQASAGVQIITAISQIRDGWHLSLDPDEGHRVPARGVSSRMMMEHALRGSEYSVEQLVVDGRSVFRNVTAKQVQPGRFPVELGHTVPADVSPGLEAALVEATERLVTVSGFGTGILHSEWIVAGEQPSLVECAARMPGDEIGTLISDAWGFDLVESYVRVLLGQRPSLPGAPVGGAAIVFLTSPPGALVAVEGLECARDRAGVRDARVNLHVGGVVPAVTSSWDRAGHVRVVAATATEARRTAEEVAASIGLTVRPLSPSPA
jgi:biotin carboxylase